MDWSGCDPFPRSLRPVLEKDILPSKYLSLLRYINGPQTLMPGVNSAKD